jgi:hypothetical protein
LVWLYFETFARFIEFSSDLISGKTGAIRRPVISSTRLLKTVLQLGHEKHFVWQYADGSKTCMNKICTLPEDQQYPRAR